MCRHAFFALSALCAFFVTTLPAAADVWSKTWPVSGTPQVVLNADDGNIRVETGDTPQVRAVIRTVGWRIADDEIRVTERQNGDRVEIELKVPSRRFEFHMRRDISIELMVPRSTALDLHTGDGNIATRGVEGPLRSDTGDGNITVVGAKGSVRLHTGDGNIDADAVDGSLSVESGDGNLVLAGRFDGIDVHTGDGNVEVTAYAGSRVASGWKFRTGDGDITVRLPEGVAADVDAHTGDGRVTCDFGVNVSGKMETGTVRGPMNGGGPPLEIHTGDGNIRVARR